MVVVDAQYVEPYTVDLAVQRKSGTNANGNFMVVDMNGNLMFKIKDTRFSLHDRHILYDATEKPVLTFKKKLRSIHGRWQAFKGDSTNHKDLLFNVKKSSTPKDETDLDVFLVENKEESVCDCKILGDWEMKSCTIYAQDGSTVLAGVHEKQNIMNVEHGKDTFGITVYPEVDYVFIVALVVILTEIKCYDGIGKKKKRKKKEKKKNDSSSDDGDTKVVAKTSKEKGKLEFEKELEDNDNDEGSPKEEDDDDDNNDDSEYEEDKSYDDESYNDDSYDDDNCDEDDDDDNCDEDDDDDDSKVYEEEPRYDEYDDNDEDNEESSSTSSEDESRDEDRKSS